MDAGVITAIITGVFGLIGGAGKIIFDKRKARNTEDNSPRLVNHPIFARLDMVKNHISMSFELKNKGKQEVFKDLLNSNIDIWSCVLKDLATELDILPSSIDSVELSAIIMKHFENGIREFNGYYRISRYTIDEQKCLDIVMAKFNKWNYPRIQTTHDRLQSICTSPFYADSKIKSAVILDLYLSYFIDILDDAESTLNELNGDLKGLVFRGVVV